MDPNDPLDEFLKQESIKEFHKDAQQTEAKPQRLRTAADEIIETIGGEPPKKDARRTCPVCSGTEFKIRRPITGQMTAKCQGCGFKMHGPGPRVVDSTPKMHGQLPHGPTYRGTRSPPKQAPHSPIARLKGRDYRALKAKDD
jgi:hypothetical protein